MVSRKRHARLRKKRKPKLHPHVEKNKLVTIKKPHTASTKAALIAATVLSLVFASLLWLGPMFSAPRAIPQEQGSLCQSSGYLLKAAIVDGLFRTKPNPTFTKNLTDCLRKAGFSVNLFQGENVTVSLLEEIGGYDLLILRLHSAVYKDGFLYIFTGERYAESKYFWEQLSGAVRKGYTFNSDEPPYFAMDPAFLGTGSPAGLNGTVIMLMGCNGTSDAYSIQELFRKGVKAYLGWNGYVDISHADKVVLRLVEALYSEKLSLEGAVEEVMKQAGPDPYYQSALEYRSPR